MIGHAILMAIGPSCHLLIHQGHIPAKFILPEVGIAALNGLTIDVALWVTVISLFFIANFGYKMKSIVASYCNIFYVPVFGEYRALKLKKHKGIVSDSESEPEVEQEKIVHPTPGITKEKEE